MQIQPTPSRTQDLHNQASRLEAAFLSQMLAHAGLDRAAEGMGGGAGAAQFASFLRDAQAESMVQAGGIGLSEALFRALVARDDRTTDAGGANAA
jgi:peptidoglycan hydrolase FlgJ